MPQLSNATAIYVGGQAATKVYLGSTQVWPAITEPEEPGNGVPATVPAFTSITITDAVARHNFTPVSGATLYRVETERVE